MKAGKLRHIIYADEPVIGQTDAGEETVTWTEAFTMRGSLEPIAGREALRAGEIIADSDTRITVRWSLNSARVTAKWRLRYEGIVFNLQRVLPIDFRRQEIEIFASSGLNQG
jgi:SPP1 family predicted phage head-tail adaptor